MIYELCLRADAPSIDVFVRKPADDADGAKTSLFGDKSRLRCERAGVTWPSKLDLAPALLATCHHIHTVAKEVLYAHNFRVFAGSLSDATAERCFPFGEVYFPLIRPLTCVLTTPHTMDQPSWFVMALRATDATLAKNPQLTNFTTTILMSEPSKKSVTCALGRLPLMTGAQYVAYIRRWLLKCQIRANCEITTRMHFKLEWTPDSSYEYDDLMFEEVSNAFYRAVRDVKAANASAP